MVFSSTVFLFLFLPAVIACYFLLPGRFRNGVLLCASILFYAWGEPRFIFILLFSVLLNYLFALQIDRGKKPAAGDRQNLRSPCDQGDTDRQTPSKPAKRDPSEPAKRASSEPAKNNKKLWLVLALVWNIGLIFVFKYLGFFGEIVEKASGLKLPLPEIALPLGISFFTFQAISYVVDVYRGEVPAQKNPLTVGLYIMLFPQLVAGPIVRYHTVEQEILAGKDRRITPERFGYGVSRFLEGLFKKLLLANQLSVYADAPISGGTGLSGGSPLYLWFCALCYMLQLYYDFSGYSDMAIGMGEMFGFHFEENFDHPYAVKSITEYWKKWHISLSGFFRDYVYIPLGGSRRGRKIWLRNMLIVWLLTGIWHGASFNFILWGLIQFVLLVTEKLVVKPEKRGKLFQNIWCVISLVTICLWLVIFHVPGLSLALTWLFCMFGGMYEGPVIDGYLIVALREAWPFLFAGLLFVFPGPGRILRKSVVYPLLLLILFLWGISFLILGGHNPFIYFNF